MNTEGLLMRLRGVRRSGSSWIAQCPGHEDRCPSLSITKTSDKILLYCFAGCAIEAICAALKINVADLFSEPRAPREPTPHIVSEIERQLAGLRSHLTPRERVSSVTVIQCSAGNLEQGIARVIALAVEGEIVQAVLKEDA